MAALWVTVQVLMMQRSAVSSLESAMHPELARLSAMAADSD
jgi:hypothetical protein